MTGLKQSELNTIREIVSSHQTIANKLSAYADQVQDPHIRQMFTQASSQAKQSAQHLIQML